MKETGTRRVELHPVLGPLPEVGFVEITVDGRVIAARAGETIAAAMLAHGIRRFRTLPDSRRPRGYFCGAGRCPDCVVTVDGVLNVVACERAVHAGMRVETQRGLGAWTVS